MISRVYVLILFMITSGFSLAQVVEVNKLAAIEESRFDGIIEANGKLSFIRGTSIMYSEDEGQTWNEQLTPFQLRYIEVGFGTLYTRGYKGLENGNYILHTRHTMHYLHEGDWKLLTIDGDSIFQEGPYILDSRALIIKDDMVYMYDDQTKSVDPIIELDDFCCPRIKVFAHHFLLQGQSKFELWTKELEYVATLDKQSSLNDYYITDEGHVIINRKVINPNVVYSNHLSISKDYGQSFSELAQSDTEEFYLIGDMNGKLYYRGYISQPEAWSVGHLQSRLGYIDLTTGMIRKTYDGLNRKYNNKPVIANGSLYHNISAGVVKYPAGDLENREVILDLNPAPKAIMKIRESDDGTLYAMTSSFLYRSDNDGLDWTPLLSHHTVVDFDIDDNGVLYCISDDQILESRDRGSSFSSLNRSFASGVIDFPHEIISVDDDKLIVKGIGPHIPQNEWVTCIDCYISYPSLNFTTSNNGGQWAARWAYHSGYSTEHIDNAYGMPTNLALQSRYYVKSTNTIHAYDLNHMIKISKEDYMSESVRLPNQWMNRRYYGFSGGGDLVRITDGRISVSNDMGWTYEEKGDASDGSIWPGPTDESLFVLSTEEDDIGSLSYLPHYDSTLQNLLVELIGTGEEVQDSFSRVYSSPHSTFLFSGVDTYEIVNGIQFQDKKLPADITVYPNPSSDDLTVSVDADGTLLYTIILYSIDGRLVEKHVSADNHKIIDIRHLTPGAYIVQVTRDNQIHVAKITVI